MTPSGVAWYQWGIPIRVLFYNLTKPVIRRGSAGSWWLCRRKKSRKTAGSVLTETQRLCKSWCGLKIVHGHSTESRVYIRLQRGRNGFTEGNPGWPAHVLLSSFSLWLLIQCWINKRKNGKKNQSPATESNISTIVWRNKQRVSESAFLCYIRMIFQQENCQQEFLKWEIFKTPFALPLLCQFKSF